ncbi:MAG: hypothetical protein IJE58_08765 [Oscillospiraceae bacterium]|nr:hypothetical protein [Oscillospiraceae bacterium]
MTLALVLALIAAVGLPLWAAREKAMSAIPEQGAYACEELSITLTFGDRTILTLPDGAVLEAAIDHGRRMICPDEGPNALEGTYEAHLEEGCIEITFDALPIPFEPDRAYRFAEITN